MCRLFLMTIACLMILFGITGLLMLPKVIQKNIEQKLQLKIGTKIYDRFTNVPIALTVKYYLFNITNSEQVLLNLERPQFQEVGPFVYKQWRRREVVDFEDDNRKLRFREYKTFYPNFSPNLDPKDYNVTIINVPLLSVLTKLAQFEEGSLKRKIAALIASRLIADGKEKILVTKPVNQILFDGYKVDLLESARNLISETLGFNFESPLPKNRFGFFYTKNGTWNKNEGGEMTVFTGRHGTMNDFMIVDNWNDKKQLTVWPSNTKAGNRCNQIKGSDGSQFHPGVTRDNVYAIFSPMVCTSIHIKFKEDTQVRGIPLLRFTTPPEIFGAPKKHPQNACYCTIAQPPPPNNNHQLLGSTKTTTTTTTASSSASANIGGGVGEQQMFNASRKISDSRCYLDGLMDLSLCQKGAPIAASSPHFYNADPMLAMATGLKPNKSIHETYLDIEPMTGSVFRAASRAQLNAYVEQAALEVIDSSIIGNMTPMIVPLLWLEESAEIDEVSSIEFKTQLLNLVQKANRSFIYSIIIGIIMVLVVSIQYWYVTCYSIDINRKEEKHQQNKSSSSSKAPLTLTTSKKRAQGSSSSSVGRQTIGGGKSRTRRPLLEHQEEEQEEEDGNSLDRKKSHGDELGERNSNTQETMQPSPSQPGSSRQYQTGLPVRILPAIGKFETIE